MPAMRDSRSRIGRVRSFCERLRSFLGTSWTKMLTRFLPCTNPVLTVV